MIEDEVKTVVSAHDTFIIELVKSSGVKPRSAFELTRKASVLGIALSRRQRKP